MTKTYAQVLKQIDTLKREADTLRRKEVDGVIDRIKDAIRAYSLTAADLGLSAVKASKAPKAAKKAAGKRKTGKAAAQAAAPKFRDEAGNVWGGRGPRPAWLRNALAAGKTLSDFKV
jgi:DNA-binding protein H-NS